MNRIARIVRHLFTGDWTARHSFPPAALKAIEDATREWETRHAGEIRFAVEAALPLTALLAGVTPRQRALQVFAQLGVWDTEHNNGVLIYLLLADHDVEIVADRGVARGRVAQDEWEACCRVMEAQFRQGHFPEGAVAGIEAVAQVLQRHPPPTAADFGNELPDAPVIL